MFSFIPALILLLLNGPSSLDRTMGSSHQNERLATTHAAFVRRHQAWLSELLKSEQGEAILAALGLASVETPKPPSLASASPEVSADQVAICIQPASANRDRDGPRL